MCNPKVGTQVDIALRVDEYGRLATEDGYILAYGGVPGCWSVKPEDYEHLLESSNVA